MSDTFENNRKTAVVLVDFQADFTEFKNGSLAVSGTNETYVKTVIHATKHLQNNGLKIFATQDWHPENHMSFSVNNAGTKPFDMIDIQGRSQIMWPAHCVQNTPGASLLIQKEVLEKVVQKGTDPDFDSYSGFADDGGKTTGLHSILKQNKIEQLIVYGLATDYCVRFTVLDAVKAGYQVKVLTGLCRGVAPDTTEAAINEMRGKGVLISEKDPSCR